MEEPINTLTLNKQWYLESIQGQDRIWFLNFGNQE